MFNSAHFDRTTLASVTSPLAEKCSRSLASLTYFGKPLTHNLLAINEIESRSAAQTGERSTHAHLQLQCRQFRYKGDQTLSMAARRLGFQIRKLQTLKAAAGVLLPNMDFRHTDQSSDTHGPTLDHHLEFTAVLLQLDYRMHSSCTRQNFYLLTTSPLPLVFHS